MQKHSIRAARPEDAAGIARVHVESWRETYGDVVPADYLHNLSIPKRTAVWQEALANAEKAAGLYVVESSGIIDGFASFGPARDTGFKAEFGYQGELYALYLMQRAQGRGLGRKLFEAAQNCLKSLGSKGMYLWVLRDNRTLNFYEHLGGREFAAKMLDIGGKTLEEVAIGWEE